MTRNLSLLLLLIIGSLSLVTVSAEEFYDLDKDGVEDSMDMCPNLKEDNEGVFDGCPSNFVPWYDHDYDGIEDHVDKCPTLKENYNKYQDHDGCPDSLIASDSSKLVDTDGDRDTDGCPDL